MTELTSGRRQVARNFAALGSGEAVSRLVAFAATVYLARVLGATAYGVIGFALAVLLYLSKIADAGVEWLGARDIAEDPEGVASVAPVLVTARLILAAVLAVLTVLGAFLVLPDGERGVLMLYSLTLVTLGLNTRWIHIGLDDTRWVAVARVAGEVVFLGLVLILVRGATELLRVPLAQVAGDLLAVAILMLRLRARGVRLPLRLDMEVLRPRLRRAAPLVGSALLGLMIFNADLIFLRVFDGPRAVGLYAAAYALISFTANLGIAYRYSLLPEMTRASSTGSGSQELYDSAMAQVFAVALPVGLGGFLVAASLIQLIFGSDYAASASALAILVWIVPLSVLRDVPTVVLLSTTREDLVLRMTAWGAGANTVLNLILIPRWGLTGAAVATLITEALRLAFALHYVHGQRMQPLPILRLWKPAAAGIAMAGILVIMNPAGAVQAIALGAVTYVVALGVVGGIKTEGGWPVLNV